MAVSGHPLAALDALLFQPSTWFAIDAANTRIPRIRPGTLEQALDLVGRGRVATVVGTLRPEVAGVDVDLPGALGDCAVEALRDWCAARGLWHLVRPSGGAPGRAHVLVAPGVHAEDLGRLVADLAHELRVPKAKLGTRQQFRPLSAPHRSAGHVQVPGDLPALLAQLQDLLHQVLPPRVRTARTAAATAAASPAPAARWVAGQREALKPRPWPRRDLPTAFAAYLQQGRAAAAAAGVDTAEDRSLLELRATSALQRAGYTEPEAWAAVTASHATAFPKAKRNGRNWWRLAWNRCVLDDATWLAAHPPSAAPKDLVPAAVAAAYAALEDEWLTWSERTRHVDREVLRAVLARLARLRATDAAIPQRDLVLDCAVATRDTVQAVLARRTDFLEVLQTYRPGTTNTANTLRLAQRFHTNDGEALTLIPPSSLQPPQPALPLRRLLGLAPSATLEALASTPDVDIEDLAARAGLLRPGQSLPSVRQLRTLTAHLQVLAGAGLASVDEHGRWHATGRLDAAAGSAVARAAEATDAAVREGVAAERAAFRAVVDPDARKARFEQQRQTALAHTAKAARSRQKAWWGSLDPDERERRRTGRSAAFAALSPADQAARKYELARARAAAGEDERARHDAWLAGLTPDELAERCIERALAYARHPAHDQQQLVAGWAEHRARWRLPHPQRRGGSVPQQRTLPEAHLLQRAAPDLEDLALFAVTGHQAQRAAVDTAS